MSRGATVGSVSVRVVFSLGPSSRSSLRLEGSTRRGRSRRCHEHTHTHTHDDIKGSHGDGVNEWRTLGGARTGDRNVLGVGGACNTRAQSPHTLVQTHCNNVTYRRCTVISERQRWQGRRGHQRHVKPLQLLHTGRMATHKHACRPRHTNAITHTRTLRVNSEGNGAARDPLGVPTSPSTRGSE